MRQLMTLVLSGLMAYSALAEETRTPVDFPPPMRAHMLANMRDHLAALADANALAAADRWDEAAEAVENRIGMSSMAAHGAAHMAPLMPPEMRAYGNDMHQAASRFSRTLQEADPAAVMAGMGDLLERCNACHKAFRLK
jgi:cytochrome c556